jgi:hypothetical protein
MNEFIEYLHEVFTSGFAAISVSAAGQTDPAGLLPGTTGNTGTGRRSGNLGTALVCRSRQGASAQKQIAIMKNGFIRRIQ